MADQPKVNQPARDPAAADTGASERQDQSGGRERAEAEHAAGRDLRELVEDLHGRREKAKLGGGEEKIAVQHERGKLTARERIDLLVDPGTFVELGIQAGPHFSQRAMEGREAPADGVITGWGDVDGRPCCIAAYDFTVMAGSMGVTGEQKVGRLRDMALDDALEYLRSQLSLTFTTEDIQEGVQAFFEKREPEWKGR